MAQLVAVDLVAAHLVINWLCIKIVGGVNKRFGIETKAKHVVLGVVEIDEDDINTEIALI